MSTEYIDTDNWNDPGPPEDYDIETGEVRASALAVASHSGLAVPEMTAVSGTSLALEAHTRATIQARCMVAISRPRNLDAVRAKLLRECSRPSFAEAVEYAKPTGDGKVTGLSIRFVETAMTCMGNIDVRSFVIQDSRTERTIRVEACDLESNVTHQQDFTIARTVERSSLGGREAVSVRMNSRGKPVYLVPATEDEMTTKVQAQTSKLVRTLGLRLVPRWLQDEARSVARRTSAKRTADDPDGARRRILDSFTELGVTPDDIAKYLEHSTEQVTPGEIEELRSIYAAIREGEATWVGVMKAKENPEDEKAAQASSAVQKARERLKSKRDEKAAAAVSGNG